MKKQFITDCTMANREDISEMIDKAIQITYRTFCKYVDILEVEEMLGYGKYLRIKNDYAVSYYRSKYKGELCYYLEWSAIEFVFI